MSEITVSYLFDPLCGWCYGASPFLDRLVAEPRIRLRLSPTGLFAGEGARPMDAGFADFAWANDRRIARLTGQVFSDAYRDRILGNYDSLFDSAPATLALTAVHLTAPDREYDALKAIQRARYVDGIDNTDHGVLASLLTTLGLNGAAALFSAADEPLLTAYHQRIQAARADMRRFGAEGVPTLITGEGDDRSSIRSNALFNNPDALFASLTADPATAG